ncbi:hypothetical protein AOQ71_21540 [Bradyrhizobium manausense]|uniref:Uncharacterized protein n=1 Tax=Bradyrhizobium manausense TaxID=989370 RepID=A0A0R3DKY8_9BRAD|nr:hypothetical protein AOQ71_21540 [Bradyrhizobium manausense]
MGDLLLSFAGEFGTFFEDLADLSETAHLVQMSDSTVIRADVSAADRKGGRAGAGPPARGLVDQDLP